MKKRLLLLAGHFCLLFMSVAAVYGQAIYNYNNATNGAYAFLAPNLTAGNLVTVGSWGGNTPCSNGGGISGITVNPSFSTYNPANASSPALNVNITPAAGYMIQVNSISVKLRRSGTGPTKARLAYSTDGGATWVSNGSDYSPNNGGCGTFSSHNWNLAAPLYVCTGMLKVRVYYFAPGSSSGTCQTTGLVVNGLVTALPVPAVAIMANPVSPICAGTDVTFTAVPTFGGTNPVYTWKKNGGTVGTNVNTYSDNNLSTTDIITCEMTSNAPCAPTDNVVSNAISMLILQPVTHDYADTICAGDTYSFGPATLNASGTYIDTFAAANTCDSIVTLHLFVRPEITFSFTDTICWGETYTWGALSPNTTGTYTQVFPSFTGCDSTVTLHLYERPEITFSFADTICWGETYTWGSLSPGATGIYTQVFPSFTGCDSTVTLHLYERPEITFSFADTICWGETYTWGGLSPGATGTYVQVFPAFSGCDSTVTLHLFERSETTFSFADTICFGGTYTWAGQAYTATGAYVRVFPSVAGCDSTVTLNLYEHNSISFAFADSICHGATYTLGSQTHAVSGVFNQTFTSYTGCDSVVTLNLYVRPEITFAFSDTTCYGQSYPWGTQVQTATGVYSQVFPATNGCDSTVTLSLFVKPENTFAFSDTVCYGQSYPWGTQVLTATGTFVQTFAAANACDSIVTLHLFVRPEVSFSFADTICYGQNYPWGTQTPAATGSYTQVFQAATGCDSTVTLHLFTRPQITFTFADTVCSGQSYTWGTQTLSASGTYNQVFTSFTGCDSTVTLNFTVNPVYTNNITASICSGTSYNFGTQVLNTAGTYTEIFTAANNCDSTVTLVLSVSPQILFSFQDTVCYGATYTWASQSYTLSGNYNQTFVTSAGCDSIVTLNLFVRPQILNSISHAVCPGTSYTWGTQTINAQGIYTQTFTSLNGCDSIVTLSFSVYPVISHPASAGICHGASFTLGTQSLTATGIYTEVFTAANGCDSTVTLSLTVAPAPTAVIIDTAACGVVLFEGGSYTTNITLQDTLDNSSGCDSIFRTVNVVVYGNTPLQKVVDTSGCNMVLFEGDTYVKDTVFSKIFTNALGCDSLQRTVNVKVYQPYADTLKKAICEGESLVSMDAITILPGYTGCPLPGTAAVIRHSTWTWK
jgi:hypothetical protein